MQLLQGVNFSVTHEHSWAAGRRVVQWHRNKASVHDDSHRFAIARTDKTAERLGAKEREPPSDVLSYYRVNNSLLRYTLAR